MITENQKQDLITGIYNVLIGNPEVGLGEMGECREEATTIVNEWIERNQIVVTESQDREFLIKDHSGRGFAGTRKHSELSENAWDFEQEDEDGLTLGDFLNTSEVGDIFQYSTTISITRTK